MTVYAALAAIVLVATSVLLSIVDKAMERKAAADFRRWADDAIDMTGGQR